MTFLTKRVNQGVFFFLRRKKRFERLLSLLPPEFVAPVNKLNFFGGFRLLLLCIKLEVKLKGNLRRHTCEIRNSEMEGASS